PSTIMEPGRPDRRSRQWGRPSSSRNSLAKKLLAATHEKWVSDVQIGRLQRVAFNKRAAWLDFVTHECGKDFVSGNGIFNLYLQQAPVGRVHGGFPKLIGVHFTQPLVTLLR